MRNSKTAMGMKENRLYYILYFRGKRENRYKSIMKGFGAKFGEDNTYFFEFKPQEKKIYDRLINEIIKRHLSYKNRCDLLILLTDSNTDFDFEKYISDCEKEKFNFLRLFRFEDYKPAKINLAAKILLLLRKHKFFKRIIRS